MNVKCYAILLYQHVMKHTEIAVHFYQSFIVCCQIVPVGVLKNQLTLFCEVE